jgi:hypothetical protein
MQELAPVIDTLALAQSLDALIAFADTDGNFVLAATLDAARVQFHEQYGQPEG